MKINISENIKSLRKQKGITQEVLAEYIGVSVQAVSKWECGLSYPDIELLPKLSSFLNVTIDFLLTSTSEKMKRPLNPLLLAIQTNSLMRYVLPFAGHLRIYIIQSLFMELPARERLICYTLSGTE